MWILVIHWRAASCIFRRIVWDYPSPQIDGLVEGSRIWGELETKGEVQRAASGIRLEYVVGIDAQYDNDDDGDDNNNNNNNNDSDNNKRAQRLEWALMN